MGKHLLFESPDGLLERLVLGKDHLHLGSSLAPAAATRADCSLLNACCEHLL